MDRPHRKFPLLSWKLRKKCSIFTLTKQVWSRLYFISDELIFCWHHIYTVITKWNLNVTVALILATSYHKSTFIKTDSIYWKKFFPEAYEKVIKDISFRYILENDKESQSRDLISNWSTRPLDEKLHSVLVWDDIVWNR